MKNAPRNLLVLAFVAIWLAPVLYYAVTNSPAPWLPEFLQRRTNVSRLFSSEVPVWAIYAVQYRTSGGDAYQFLAEEDFFRMKPFGRRTRLQKVIAIASPQQREELCQWLHKRLEASTKEKITSLRISAYPSTTVPTVSGTAYRQPDPQSIDPNIFEVLTQVDFPAR